MYIVLLHYNVYFMVTSEHDEMMQTIDCVSSEMRPCSERRDNWGALFEVFFMFHLRRLIWRLCTTARIVEIVPFYTYHCQFI